ncbi:precorrin 6A synthase [Sinorhizobium fredii USDA 205]|uniref:Precorrin-6A synthase [deacetylating] n=1 Tax=Rhizobium fredii TaxID=380 RepID=A0A2A6LZC1_RHIFR|nr:precorrin-6A synthase (deacetylating) [Sinorhizobium fredii]AWM26642.1 Precorrin-6A synthase [Sinorhizobium fredii CCBAU 25509]KSV90542.1 precorrin 6A synthase [Sinorhizobium fredii USDA 205]MCG5474749.1 precorrin-6A synthase (deacetylating) [Sinorhizobium fredii]MQW96933.1 precorrin-6A synthase (deacetylating) [Sinorhizobium fredii]MQX09941.1 precorrin-6A synthase (deacetylating) [Sinorhizobium fredii]
MRHILIIGIGAGNPEHITVQAINALNRADVLFIPTKGAKKTELAEVRREICARYVTRSDSRTVEFAVPVRRTEGRSYVQSVDDWHASIAATYEALLEGELAEGQSGAFLVWGDPMLYDSTIRIVERVRARGQLAFDFGVIPGITSLQALCASHRIPLNLVGKPVEITTGRRLAESFPQKSETAVVMLDGEQAFHKIDDPDAEIYWGAYLGTPDEIVISGRLADVKEDILKARAEARERMGWIMDIYLLRKGADFDE